MQTGAHALAAARRPVSVVQWRAGAGYRERLTARCCCIDNNAWCCYNYNMLVSLIHKAPLKLSDTSFAEVVIWQLPQPLPGSVQSYKYRLACVVDEVCVLRYDNESGKGDHKHVGEGEEVYRFTNLDQLVVDFWADMARLGRSNEPQDADD